MASHLNTSGDFARMRCFMRTLQAFREKRTATQAELIAAADTRAATMGRYIKLLQEAGWIRPSGEWRQGPNGGPAIVWEWVA